MITTINNTTTTTITKIIKMVSITEKKSENRYCRESNCLNTL